MWRVLLAGKSIIATSSPWAQQVNQVIVSKDEGRSFSLVRNGLPLARPKVNTMWGQGYPRAFSVDPNNSDIIYLGIDGDDQGGLYVSKDQGSTWVRSQGQPGSLRIYRALSVDPTDSKRIVWGACAKGGGVYLSEDAGKTFQYVFSKMQWVFDSAISSNGTIYVAGDNGGAQLYASKDHGKTWKLAGSFEKDRALAAVSVNPSNPKQIAVSTASWNTGAPNKIYLSEDEGENWKDISGDLADGSGASSIVFDPAGRFIYIAKYAGSIYRLAL